MALGAKIQKQYHESGRLSDNIIDVISLRVIFCVIEKNSKKPFTVLYKFHE